MKTKHFNDRGMRYASAFLFITAMMLGFAACSNDNDVPDGGGNVTPEDTTEVNVYDDLNYFQNAIVEVFFNDASFDKFISQHFQSAVAVFSMLME